jgi:hypothetical protein
MTFCPDAVPGLPPPKAPVTWRKYDRQPDLIDGGVHKTAWRRGRLLILSSVEMMDFRGALRPQWLVSVSARGRGPASEVQRHPERFRASDADVVAVLRDFDMERAEEDNHQPGCARMFFLLCDARPDDPQQCECKETEEVVVESDGFTWSRERPAPRKVP